MIGRRRGIPWKVRGFERFKMTEIYQIRVKGHLEPHWSEWFDDLTIIPEANGETKMILHRLPSDGFVRVIMMKGEGVLAFFALELDLFDLRKKVVHRDNPSVPLLRFRFMRAPEFVGSFHHRPRVLATD